MFGNKRDTLWRTSKIPGNLNLQISFQSSLTDMNEEVSSNDNLIIRRETVVIANVL